MRISSIIFVALVNSWAIVYGALYAFPAWIAPLKAKYDLSQTTTLMLGTSIYAGWLIGIPLSTVVYEGVRRCCSRNWQADVLVFGVSSIIDSFGFWILRYLFDSSPSASEGAALCVLSSSMMAVTLAMQFGIYFKHLVGVIATPRTTLIHVGILYATYALGGTITVAIASRITTSSDWVRFFDILFALHLVTGVVTNVVCGAMVRKHENEMDAMPLIEVPPVSQAEDIAQPVLESVPEHRTWRLIVREFVTSREGWLVMWIFTAKCFVGPVLTTQSSTMYKSADTSLSEFTVVVTLNVGQTIGRSLSAVAGAWPTVCGYDTTVVLNAFYGVLFLVPCVVGSFVLNDVSIMLSVAMGGVAYGMMWATDSPTFLKATKSGLDWPVLVCVMSVVELIGCFSGNGIAGAIYDAHGYDTTDGVQCKGLPCVQGTFVMMSVCSICIIVGAVCFAIALRRRTGVKSGI